MRLEKLGEHMDELNLKCIPKIYQDEAIKAAENNLDYAEYLSKLVEEEYTGMIERSINHRIKTAGFPRLSRIEEYDFTCQPELNEKLIRNLCILDFLNNAMNVLFVGPAGVGKTHLSIGLGVKACQKRKRVLFYTAQELLEDLTKAKLMGKLGKELSRLGRLDLLIIDELGYMDINRESAALLFQVISRRYEHGSIIITTNKPFEEWGTLFKDTALATTILDRLLHHSYVFYITGKSYRLKQFDSIELSNNRKTGD